MDGGPGLRFDYGIVYGKEPIFTPGGAIDLSKPFTILMEVRAHAEPTEFVPRILSAYDANGCELFFVGQWRSGLVMRILEGERFFRLRYRETGAAGLQKDITRSIAVRSDGDSLTIFVDGTPVKTRPGVSFSLLTDKQRPAWMILGNSPSGEASWRGDLLSLSLFSKALSPGDIASGVTEPIVRYRFSEGSGTICRESVDPRYNLVMPPIFRAPVKGILVPPWKIQNYNRSFWNDMFVNILGFIPFGFAASGWIWKGEKRIRPAAIVRVILLGAGVSLLIELVQVYLPTRDSSLTDVINNTLGAIIGVWLFRKGH